MAYAAISKPSLHNNAVLYTGDASTQAVTGVGFQSDFTWIKSRSDTYNHQSFNSLTGATKSMTINESAAEITISGLTAFGADGFTVGTDAQCNNNASTYIGYNWKGGTTTGITQGSATITPTSYSFNQTAGFSVIRFTTPSSGTGTVPHGLGAAPAMILGRILGSSSWQCGFTSLNSGLWTSILTINDTAAELTSNTAYGDTPPDTTLFTMNSSNWGATQDAIAYCFAEIKGYSKGGTYLANSDSNGPFCYTGFKPSWILIKSYSGGSAGSRNWMLFDSKRLGYNADNNALKPDADSAADTSNYIDFLSNGFKIRSTDGNVNTTSENYNWWAFAEQPLVANVGSSIPTTARQDMFGITAFCEAPFASQDIGIRIVEVTGVQVNTALGSSTISGNATVTLTGNALSILTGTATVSVSELHPVTGVQVEVALGTQTIAGGADVSVTGNVLSLDLGTVTVEVTTNVPVTGVQLQAQTGSVTIQGNATITVTGNALSVATGEAVAQPWTQVDDTNANTWTRVDQEINYGVNIQYNARYRKNGSW